MQKIICLENNSFLASIYENLGRKILEKECFVYSTLDEGLTHIPNVKPDLLLVDFDTIGGKIDKIMEIAGSNTKIIITSRTSTQMILPYENWVKPIPVELIQRRFFELFGEGEGLSTTATA